MGRVRTKTVKRSSKIIIERYYPRLTLDFEVNKRTVDEVAVISSKRVSWIYILRKNRRLTLTAAKQGEIIESFYCNRILTTS
jgi:ribosomal protein S17E